jgi:hypothetical protein
MRHHPDQPVPVDRRGHRDATKVDAGVRNIVYVAAGLYTEKLTLVGGVIVQGGWHWDGGPRWSFDCGSAPESVVIVQAPSTSNMTIDASSDDGMTTLSTLTVLSKAASAVQPGESLYGVFATGVNTVLALTDVVVTMQAGGAGQAGATGGVGSTAPGPCAVGDGASATISGAEGTAGSDGTLSSTGFTTPPPGGTGGSGVAGDNGAAGGAPVSVMYSACASVNPCTVEQATCAGGYGVNGCGGSGGLGGGGGAAGGSSVALFAYDATVTVTAGALRAGTGATGVSEAPAARVGPGAREHLVCKPVVRRAHAPTRARACLRAKAAQQAVGRQEPRVAREALGAKEVGVRAEILTPS